MLKAQQRHYLYYAWMLIGLCTVVRIVYAQSFLLTPDETNYWQWSRYLDWGYHDQTPMIGWAIHFFTLILGQTELAVRSPSVFSMTIASIYLVLIARHWFCDDVAWQTAVLSQTIFIFNAGALLATADGLQGAAWAGASYHVARGFEKNEWRQWLIGGAWFGFGLLSKYTMVLFLPFIFIFGLMVPDCRKKLATIRPWVGCILGLLMFLPVILWNAANNWNSFRHVAYLGGANEGFALHWKYLGEYLGSQIGLITPIAFGLICAAWFWVVKYRPSADKWIYYFLFATSLPMIGFFTLLSLHTRVYGNWPCAGYLTACVLAAVLWSGARKSKADQTKGKVRKIWYGAWGSAVILTAIVLIHVHQPILPIPPDKDRTIYELRGWDDLGRKVADVRNTMPHVNQTFVFGLRYQVASELAFYMPGQPLTVSINRWNRPNVYDYWWQDDELMGKDAIGVSRDEKSGERLLEVFERVEPAEPFHLYATEPKKGQTPVRTLFIYRCFGFKGGLRWIPPQAADIRAGGS